MSRRWLIWSLGVWTALGGCSGPGGAQGHADGSRRTLATNAARPQSPVFRSVLREQAIERLQGFTSDENAMVRAHAIEALVDTPGRLAGIVPIALQDENEGVRSVAAMAVGKARTCDLVPLVEPLVHDPSPFVQVSAIYAQAACGDERHVERLASFLLRHPQTRVRAHAAFVLGELGNPSATGLLRQAAAVRIPTASDAEHRLLQLQIAEALAKLGDMRQVEMLHAALFVSRAEDLEGTALAAQILGEILSRNSIPDLVNLVAYRDEGGNRMPAEVRLSAGISLAKMGRQDAFTIAQEYLGSENPLIRSQCAVLLGETRADEAITLLEGLMDDPNPLVRVAACAGVLRATDSTAWSGIQAP